MDMTIQEIKKKYKTEKRQNKKMYKENRKRIKTTYTNHLMEITSKHDMPYRSILEEIGNSITHGIGSILSIVALILMLISSNNGKERIGGIMYFIGLFTSFTMSCLYHAFPYASKVKRVFRRFDYLSIYLLIGATFAPILLEYIGGKLGMIFFIMQWSIIVLGIIFVAIFGPNRLKVIHIILYFMLGWSGLIFLPQMVKNDFAFFCYILGGGIVYSLGIIPFAINKKTSHFIWHFFVLAGAIIQWIGVYLYIYL